MKCLACNGEGGDYENFEYGENRYLYECDYCMGAGEISLLKWLYWELCLDRLFRYYRRLMNYLNL